MTQEILLNLDRNTLTQLNATCQLVLQLINSLCKTTQTKSPSKAFYCFPSEDWLARRIGKSRVQVSRSVSRLKMLGLISITYRRKVRGIYQTNLYRLGRALLFALNKAKALKNGLSYRVTSMLHRVSNTLISKEQKGLRQHLKGQVRGPTWEQIAQRIEEKYF
jgi:hypothetical protein